MVRIGLFIKSLLLLGYVAGAQTVFTPPATPLQVKALQINTSINIDGKLQEPGWQQAEAVTGFTQVEPNQGEKPLFPTTVKVLFDERNLYIGAFCYDSLGRKGLRVPDLKRDFDFNTHDIFGVAIDAFTDKRNAMVFQTNPYGSQRDLLAFDDTYFDNDWDGLWKVRTQMVDSGWVAELMIPWSTLRYPKFTQASALTVAGKAPTDRDSTASPSNSVPEAQLPSERGMAKDDILGEQNGKLLADSRQWGIIFLRRARRTNEMSAWPAYPRAFNPYRMSYEGLLTSITPPPPTPNIRLQPYTLLSADRSRVNGELQEEELKPKLGGELKWAVNPNTIVDLTVNTDFAQADVDRQVQNLSRFSVFFPERRQFFLENASQFLVGKAGSIQPFFSRRIGLDEEGNPIPIDGGVRIVNRTSKRTIGGLLMRQRESGNQPAANFAVGRFSQNIGKQNRIGGLATLRYDEPRDSLGAVTNAVGAIDGFFRISQPFSLSYMVSASSTGGKGGDGMAGFVELNYNSNQWYAYAGQSVITRDYRPATGFVYSHDLVNTYFGGYPNWRPKWKPDFIRSFEPDLHANFYHRAGDGKLQQWEINSSPLFIQFQNAAFLIGTVTRAWQRLDEPLSPLGVDIGIGTYAYNRYKISYTSDRSKKIAYGLDYENGGYYNGKLEQWVGFFRFAPIPHIFLSLDYERNRISRLGEENISTVTHLITPQVRLAVNPRLQLIGFYQRNTASNRDVWNLRLAWEFKPLSFLYLVYNDNTLQTTDRLQSQQLLGKITYLKQF